MPYPDYAKILVGDGFVFDLGGQVLLSEHGPSYKAILLDKVQRHLNNMLRLKKRSAEFAYLCPAHNGAPVACSYIGDFIGLGRAMLRGDQHVAPGIRHWYVSRLPFSAELKRAVYGDACFIYREAGRAR